MDGLIRNREALGISLADVARWSGVALATIRRHEAGELIVTPSTRERLARTYAAIEALRNAVPEGEELARAAGTFAAVVEAGTAARKAISEGAELEELDEEGKALEELADKIEASTKRTRERAASIVDMKVTPGRTGALEPAPMTRAAYLMLVDTVIRTELAKTPERDVDDVINETGKAHGCTGRELNELRKRFDDAREQQLRALEDRHGALEGTHLRAGDECGCLLYEKIGKAKSATLIGAARVVVVEASDSEAIVRVIKTSPELARFVGTEQRRKRDEIFAERSKDERNAFRALVSKYWGKDVPRGESANATARKASEKKAKRAK